jgi:transcriptional regulator with XRE-family HTH domain
MDNAAKTLSDLLSPYKSGAIAEAVGVGITTVQLWKSRKTAPAVGKIPALAAFLRVDVSVVVEAITAQREAVA